MILWGVFLLFLVSIRSESDPNVKNFEACAQSCPALNKDACQTGCKIAHALAQNPTFSSYDPSCQDACKDKFSTETLESSCEAGCEYYPVSGGIASVFRKMLSSLSGVAQTFGKSDKLDEVNPSNVDKNDDSGVFKVTRVRIITSSDPFSFLPNFVRSFFHADPSHKNEQPLESNENLLDSAIHMRLGMLPIPIEKQQPQKISVCQRMGAVFREIANDPFKLMLGLIVVLLFVSLVTQVVVYCIRRGKRSHGYQYSQLPTYAEAIDVKIPLMTEIDEENEEKCMKSTKKSSPMEA